MRYNSCMSRRLLMAAVLAAFLSALGSAPAPGAESDGREGEVIPFFQSQDLQGDALDLRAVAREKTVLIFFWNAYKTMSIKEMNYLNGIYDYYSLYGLEVVAVEGGGRGRDAVEAEVEKLKVIGTVPAYRVIPDPGGRIAGLFRVAAIPETFIISRGGKILLHLKGFRAGDEAALETKIKDLLGLLPAPASLPGKSAPADPVTAAPPSPKKGITVDPERQLMEKHHYFGNYYFKRGEMSLALENYERCLEIDPQATEIYLRVGEIHAALKNYELAREAWEKVLQYDPDNREADALIRRLIRGEF